MRRGEGRVERGGRRRGVKGYGDEREVRGREGEGGYIVEGEVCAPDSGPLSQRAAIAKVRGTCMQNRKTNTNPSPDPNRYRRRCPDPNARIQKFIHYMAIATFAIADCHRAPYLQVQVLSTPLLWGRSPPETEAVSLSACWSLNTSNTGTYSTETTAPKLPSWPVDLLWSPVLA